MWILFLRWYTDNFVTVTIKRTGHEVMCKTVYVRQKLNPFHHHVSPSMANCSFALLWFHRKIWHLPFKNSSISNKVLHFHRLNSIWIKWRNCKYNQHLIYSSIKSCFCFIGKGKIMKPLSLSRYFRSLLVNHSSNSHLIFTFLSTR